MPARTFVGFVADFSVDSRGDEPPGEALAQFFAQQLALADYSVSGPQDNSWGWCLLTRLDDVAVVTVLALVDDMETMPPRQWLATNECEVGWLRRVFESRSARLQREQTLREYCQTLHAALSADTRFTHLTWYHKETFDKPGDKPGSEP